MIVNARLIAVSPRRQKGRLTLALLGLAALNLVTASGCGNPGARMFGGGAATGGQGNGASGGRDGGTAGAGAPGGGGGIVDPPAMGGAPGNTGGNGGQGAVAGVGGAGGAGGAGGLLAAGTGGVSSSSGGRPGATATGGGPGTGGRPTGPDAGVDAPSDGPGGSPDGGLPLVCGPDMADCNRDPRDGCEVSLDSPLNCGRCGNSCPAANATAACVNRQCAPLTCSAGFADCNTNRVDGCETSLDGDAACGGCDRRCASPTPYCGLSTVVRACINPVQVLVDQRAELPCVAQLASVAELCASVASPSTACPAGGKILRRVFTVGGRAGTIYNVTLRIRGLVEPKVYAGGRGPGDHFYFGGAPTATNYNSYALTVSSPAQTYFLNYDEAAGESYTVFPLDHTKVLQIASGATVALQITDPDCVMVKNCQSFATATCQPYVVPGIPPAPDGFAGQFVHIDVVSVVAVP